MGVIFNSSSESPWASVPTVARTNFMETKSIWLSVARQLYFRELVFYLFLFFIFIET